MADSSDQVLFQCIQDGRKLRVRILTPGYHNEANCQFPRDIRAPGKYFTAPASSVRFVTTPKGTVFYRVTKSLIKETAGPGVEDSAAAAGGGEINIPRIYDVDVSSDECIICMENEKTQIYIPCGHYCACIYCSAKLDSCPLCRGSIERMIHHDEIS